MPHYPKTLEVRGDYSSSGIWTRKAAGLLRGGMVSHVDLALPEELSARFSEWLRRHDLHGRKSGFDVVTFDAIGMKLTRDLQALVGQPTEVSYTPFETERGWNARSIVRWIASQFRDKP
jgi:hypothetical protein